MNSPNNNKTILSFKKNKYIYVFGVLSFLASAFAFSQEIDPNGYNVFYHENGRISSEGNFKDGLPNGIWKSYYADGTLKSIGKKQVGLSDSVWTFYDYEGRKIKQFDYEADKKNGCAVFYDTLGNVVREYFYINDVLQGDQFDYYATGELKKQTNFTDGKSVGVSLEFNTEGDVITEEVYDNGYLKDRKEFNRFDEKGLKTGIWRTYFPNGMLESEISYKDGKKDGLTKYFNKKGKLLDIKKMEGDTIAGHSDEIVIIELYKEYYPDGKIKLIGGNDNGLRSGIFREYDKKGEIINGYIFENDTMVAEGIITGDGIYEGEWKYFYKSGEVRSSGTYLNSRKEGPWIYYYSNGKKEQEGSYKEDILSGEWKWYYRNGQIQRIEYYNRKARLEGTVFEYDSLGNEMTKGDYFNGLREGEWFYHVGDYKEVGAYTLGMETGLWTYYYLSGKVAFRGEFDEGEAKGKHIYYHQNGVYKKVGKYLGGEKHGKWRSYNERGELTQIIEYKRGEIYKIDGFKVFEIREEN